MHHDRGVCLRSAQQPADPIGSTRRPIICSGTPGPARSMTPTPSKPGTNGNVMREAYAPETDTASEGFTAAAIIRTLTSCRASPPAPEASRTTSPFPAAPGAAATAAAPTSPPFPNPAPQPTGVAD